MIANQSGVTSRLESIVDAIRRHGEIRIKAIYAPEHGFRGDRNAGASVASYLDSQTRLPVYSLYGASRHPSAARLEDVDVLLFDIQDVGSRAYTYISTMAYAMQSAREHGKEFWVLDRLKGRRLGSRCWRRTRLNWRGNCWMRQRSGI